MCRKTTSASAFISGWRRAACAARLRCIQNIWRKTALGWSKENKVQKYKVTLILTADDYMDLAPRLGSHGPKIEKVVESIGGAKLDQSAMRAPRGKRKSKVVETILSALQDGSAPASSLRGALAARGMAESSLSTGLSILQKSGQIERDPNGNYFLTAREAA